MIQGHSRSWSTYLVALIAASSVACYIEAPKKAPLNTEPDDKAAVEEPTTSTDPLEPVAVADSGAFGKAPPASSSSGNVAQKKFCAGDVKPGDLAVTEIMISSKTGSGDAGEWVEVQSTRDCWLKIGGLTVESPRGAAADTATMDADYELAPGATFVVAGSLDSTKNHGLKGKVISWDATDVLKNDGDSIIVKLGGVEIDKLTYPSLTLTAGSSMSFPEGCGDRGDWTKWAASSDAYNTTFKGTPNATNDDVLCAK